MLLLILRRLLRLSLIINSDSFVEAIHKEDGIVCMIYFGLLLMLLVMKLGVEVVVVVVVVA